MRLSTLWALGCRTVKRAPMRMTYLLTRHSTTGWLMCAKQIGSVFVATRRKDQGCAKLLKGVRDCLQAIDSLEGSFQYSRVPVGFKSYKMGVGEVERAKTPAKKVPSGTIRWPALSRC